MVQFSVMILDISPEVFLQKANSQQGCNEIAENIIKKHPDVVFMQGITQKDEIKQIDQQLKKNGFYCSYCYRETEKGVLVIMINPSTFHMKTLKPRKFERKCKNNTWCEAFNNITFTKLTHKHIKRDIYIASWPNTHSVNYEEKSLLVHIMKETVSDRGLWLIAGQYESPDDNNNNNNIKMFQIDNSTNMRNNEMDIFKEASQVENKEESILTFSANYQIKD